jgi:hypothetical protein
VKLTAFTERVLATKRGEFWLAWSISLLLGMFWVVYLFINSPSFHDYPNRAVIALGGTIVLVAVIAAIVILLIARPIEKFYTRRGIRTLPAALGYLVLLVGVGFALSALGFAIGYNGLGLAGLIVGMALVFSSPIAFVGRLIYPSLKSNPQTSGAVLLIASALASFGLISLLLQPLLR